MSRIAVITLSSLLLVGLVGAVTFGFVTNWGSSDNQKLASTSKAVQAICSPTDYKDACVKSLASEKTDDPKELVKAAFASAKAELNQVASNSTTLKELENNPNTAQAVKDCKELFQDAIDDFQRSFDEIGKFEWDQVNHMLSNLKTWLSATRTYQETCLDGFENTTGDASEKVRKVLQTAMQMSSNGLAIVNDLSTLFTNLDISTFNRRRLLSHSTAYNRRLLGDDDGGKNDVLLQDNEEDRRRRKLLSSAQFINGHSSSEEFLPDWIDGFRRKLLEATSLTDDLKAKANVVVAQDGSGKYKTIEEALKDIPKNGNETFVVYIKEGVYNEYLVVLKWMTNVVFVGDGPTKTKITNNKNFADGTKTFKTATLSVLGDLFMAKDIGVENSAGAIKHQAVAIRVQSDKSILYNCQFDGYQDTLYVHTYRQFYRDCKVTGTIDFIFGDATAFFQNCTFVVRKPLENQNCIVTAQGRMERHQPTGIFIHKSNFGLDTSYYGEYNNFGPGSSLANRVKWRGVKTIIHDRAEKFMPVILFESDDWIKASNVPYEPNFVDEDPNAPAGAPSSFPYDSSSSGRAVVVAVEVVLLHSSSSSSSSTEETQSSETLHHHHHHHHHHLRHQDQLLQPPTTATTTTTTDVADAPTSAPAPAPTPTPTPSSEVELATLSPTQSSTTSPTDLTSTQPNTQAQQLQSQAQHPLQHNVPDGDEPSPARVEPPSPTPSPSTITISPTPSPTASAMGQLQMKRLQIGCTCTAPEPDDGQEADKMPPTSDNHPPPKPNSGSITKFQTHFIFSGMFMWAALFM
ncbi:putative pectinesterase/pectinesterase inhibitor 21 [Bienertia sinuspersici]